MERMVVWFLLLVVRPAMAVVVLAQSQDQNPGFISIDCGAPNDYYDDELRVYYKTDAGFIDSGKNMQISTQFIYQYIRQQGKNLRVFRNGTRNCYTLRPDKGKENRYLVRASFYYGNYDDDIQVCLVNTGNGFPFISALELRLLDNSLYPIDSASLSTNWRYDIGSSETYRYPQDVYDRIWSEKIYSNWAPFNIMVTTTLSNNNDAYQVPEEVLRTAQRAADVNSSIYLSWNTSSTYKWCIYFHFAELEILPSGQQREFTVTVNGKLTETVTPEYLKPVTVVSALVSGAHINLSIDATQQSGQYPPILNAIEFFTVVEHLNTPTAMDDITAINNVKKAYGIKKDSWQGDPCAPKNFIWEGLECSYERNGCQ